MQTETCPENYIVTNNDIKNIYEVSDNILFNSATIIKSKCNESKESKELSLELHKDSILLTELFNRIYFEKKELISSGEIDKVVFHKNFELKEAIESGQGYTKLLHPLEYDYYKEHGFKEIQLAAIEDGLIVWLKCGFRISDKESINLLFSSFKEYIISVKKNVEFAKTIDETFLNEYGDLDIDEDFFIEEDLKEYFFDESINFTDWFSSKISSTVLEQEHKIGCIHMYKEVA